LHGGLALQEIVVPHVATWSIRRPQKMRVQCALTATETATLTVKVILISAPPAPTTLYDQAMGRTLEVFISKDSALVSQAKTVTIEPSNQEQTQTVTIFLNDSAELKRGQVLTLHARDVDTEEELVGGLTLTVARDF
jgi:hypothetical protein